MLFLTDNEEKLVTAKCYYIINVLYNFFFFFFFIL